MMYYIVLTLTIVAYRYTFSLGTIRSNRWKKLDFELNASIKNLNIYVRHFSRTLSPLYFPLEKVRPLCDEKCWGTRLGYFYVTAILS